LIGLSDDQTTKCLPRCNAAARIVFLSQRLAAAAGNDVDIYLQSIILGSVPIKLVQGDAGAGADNAVPNWTYEVSGVLTRGEPLFGGTRFNGSALSSYNDTLAPGEYQVIAVPTGTDPAVATNNLLPGARVCLRRQVFHTIVISDANNQTSGYGLRVYTDGPCCCPESSSPIFIQPSTGVGGG
jgi:hypothetical protein